MDCGGRAKRRHRFGFATRKLNISLYTPHSRIKYAFMKTNLDIKSALIGLGFGVMIMVGIGAASSGSAGRYQIASTPNHGLVLDTATGQVWSTFLSSSGGRADRDFYEPKIGQKK